MQGPAYVATREHSYYIYFVMGNNFVEVCQCFVENRKGGLFQRQEFAKKQTEAILHPPEHPIRLQHQSSQYLKSFWRGLCWGKKCVNTACCVHAMSLSPLKQQGLTHRFSGPSRPQTTIKLFCLLMLQIMFAKEQKLFMLQLNSKNTLG